MIYSNIKFTASERGILLPAHSSKKWTKPNICSLCTRSIFCWSCSLNWIRYVTICFSDTFLTYITTIKTHINIVLFSSVMCNIRQYESQYHIRMLRICFGRYTLNINTIIWRYYYEKRTEYDGYNEAIYYITKMDKYNKDNIVVILRGKIWKINKCCAKIILLANNVN